jgi:hypothetical protein
MNPTWASRALLETAGRSNYNAGFLKFDRSLRKGLLFGIAYTFSAALDDGPGPPQDVGNFRREYSRSDWDRLHRFSAYYLVHATRSFQGRSLLLRSLVAGWQVAGYSEWQSGQPFTITTGVDSNGDQVINPLSPAAHPDRPDYNPNGSIQLDPVTHDWRSFRSPVDGTGLFVTPVSSGGPLPNSMRAGGSLGRNTFRGPAYSNTNLSLLKEFHAAERVLVEVRASWVNAWNHRNFGPPISVMARPDFGSNKSNPEARTTILGLRIRF